MRGGIGKIGQPRAFKTNPARADLPPAIVGCACVRAAQNGRRPAAAARIRNQTIARLRSLIQVGSICLKKAVRTIRARAGRHLAEAAQRSRAVCMDRYSYVCIRTNRASSIRQLEAPFLPPDGRSDRAHESERGGCRPLNTWGKN